MTRLFMLEFKYAGERFFANVIEHKHSPAIYYVNLINAPHLRPRKLIFETVDDKIELSRILFRPGPNLWKLFAKALRNT